MSIKQDYIEVENILNKDGEQTISLTGDQGIVISGTITSTVSSGTGRIRSGAAGQLHLGDDSDIISVGRTNEIWSMADVDSDQTLYVNYRGYNNAATRFRSFDIRDGKGAQIAHFNGSDKKSSFTGEVECISLDVNGVADISGLLNSAEAEILNLDARILQNDEGSNKNRLLFPGGASYNGSGTETGAIKIKLPTSWTNTMMKMKVRVFDYAQNESFDVNLAGYTYTGGGGSWINTSAWIDSQADLDRNFTVRFGYANSCCTIYIGELDSTWAYLKVNVVDVMLNHSGTTGAWATGTWAISLEASAFAAVTQSRTNTQVNSWKRDGTQLSLAGGASSAVVSGLFQSGGVTVGSSSLYSATGGGDTLASFTGTGNDRQDIVVSNQTNHADAAACLVLATHGHDYMIKGTSSAGGSILTLGHNTTHFLSLTSSQATFLGEVEAASLDINGNADISGTITSAGFVGRLQGAITGAPDATIWCVSGQYTDWGIFYDENTPDVIQFKAGGTTKATISLDNGDYTGRNLTLTGEVEGASLDINGVANISGSISGLNGSLTTTANYFQLNTPSGYIQMGAMNTGHAHMYTDRADFYFNKAISINGANVLTAVPNHSGGLITSGTVAASRVATLNQNTTGTAAGLTGITSHGVVTGQSEGGGITTLAPNGSASNLFLRSRGTGTAQNPAAAAPTFSTVAYADLSGTVPTFNQNTTGTATGLTGLTASRVMVSAGNGTSSISPISTTKLGYLSGVTSSIQTQLNAKQATLTFGISNTNSLRANDSLADDDFLRVNGSSIEGRTAAEVLSDIGAQGTLTFGIGNTHSLRANASLADNDFLRVDGSLIEGRTAAQTLSDIGAAAALGNDDNYVTDSEKTVIGNTSGTNSGDVCSSNHTGAGYLTSLGSAIVDGDFTGTSGFMKKSSAGTYTLDNSTYLTSSSTASKVTVTDSTANTAFPVVFHDESNGLLDDTGATVGLMYNPSLGSLFIPDYLVHSGDGDTYIRFGTNSILIVAGDTDLTARWNEAYDATNTGGVLASFGSDFSNHDSGLELVTDDPNINFGTYSGNQTVAYDRTTLTFHGDFFKIKNDHGSGAATEVMTFDKGGRIGLNKASPLYGVHDSRASGVDSDWYLANGSIGVGTTPHSTDGRCDITNIFTGLNFTSSSDARLKKDIKNIPSHLALNVVKQLQGVRFNWLEKHETSDWPERHQDKKINGVMDMGFIAQDVEKLLPEVVETNEDNKGFKTIAYGKMVAILTEAIKEQQKQIDKLQKQINEL